MKALIVGIGLIGGSFALSLKEKGVCSQVFGFDLSADNAQKALDLKLVDKIMSIDEALPQVDLIVLASPVNSIPLLATKILNKISPSQIVIDTGSIKSELCEVIQMHKNRARFVATHPMWGTEYSGPEAAVHGAFSGRKVVICNKSESASDALETVENIYREFGMSIIYMQAEDQDLHSAYVSHISHITSFALALTVLEKERETQHIFDLAGGGFASTVRLAKSSAKTWTPIFLGNKYNILDVLREHIHQLQIFRQMIERDDAKGITEAINKANSIRKILG